MISIFIVYVFLLFDHYALSQQTEYVFINFLKDIDLEIYVDKKSLDERGLTKDDLIDSVEIKEHGEILKIIENSTVTIPF